MRDAANGRGGAGARFIPVIIAGGQAQRLRPLSTADRAKRSFGLERSGRTKLQAALHAAVLDAITSQEGEPVGSGFRVRRALAERRLARQARSPTPPSLPSP